MKLVQKIDRKEWSNFVFNHPHGNVFQTPEMYEVYKKTKNYEPLCLAAVNGKDEILGVLLSVIHREDLRIIGKLTSRSIVFGGPLLKDNDLKSFDFILKAYDEIVKNKALYSQFRNLWSVGNFREIFGMNNYQFEDHLNIIIDLRKSEEQLWKEIHPTRRKQIRRATKRGTSIKELKGHQAIDAAYRILLEVYKNAKLPLPDKSLFLETFESMYPHTMAKCFGAVNEDRIIGTRFILTYRKTIYDWYAGSSYQFRNLYPNDLLPWEIFKWGKLNGFETFDFGGAGKPSEKYGVRDYKKKFGGMIVEYGRLEKIHKPFKYKLAKAGFKLWRALK